LSGLSANIWQLAALRFIAALGMGGEWALGVALVMEVWPNRSRVMMAGLIGAASPVGYMAVGFLGLGMSYFLAALSGCFASFGIPQDWSEWLLHNGGWRIILIMGAAPALLTFFIRLFVPESQRWQREQDRGAISNWATRDLLFVLAGAFGPALIIYLWADPISWAEPYVQTCRVVGTLVGLFIATAGYMCPVLLFLRRSSNVAKNRNNAWWPTVHHMFLAAALSGVALLGTWGSTQWAPAWADMLAHGSGNAKEWTQIWSSIGAIVGTLAAAFVSESLGRRATYSLMCLLSLGSLIIFYQGNANYGLLFLPTAFLMGACTASFYGWLPLYLPELFHTNVRATAMGFGFNFGRILAAVGALQVGTLFAPQIALFGRTFTGGYPFACSMMSAIYLIGILVVRFAPETRGQPLPE